MRLHRIIHQPAGAVAAAAALVLALAPLRAAALDFDAPFREYMAGIEAVALAPGDYDRDGLTDVLVSVDAPLVDLVFMRQNPDHSFSNAGSWDTGDFLYELAAGDFNGDGLLDVAGLTFSSQTRVIFGDGAGWWSAFVDQAAPPGAHDIARANFNGPIDGDDLVVSSYSWSQLQTYTGALGAITPQHNYATLGYPAAIATGDLDGDGYDDIVTVHEFVGAANLLFTDGTGQISSQMVLSGTPFYSSAAAIHDVSGDGHNDVLVGSAEGTGVGVFLYLGAASYSTPLYYGGLAGSANFSLHCADLDGDSDADVVLGGTTSHVLFNSGTGTFTAPGVPALPPGVHNFSEVQVADLDGDGAVDVLAAGNYGAALLVARGNGDGTFGTNLVEPAALADRALLADVDGDLDDDLVVLDGTTGMFGVLPRTPTGFDTPVLSALPAQPYGLARGDFEPDGRPDFVTATPSNGNVEVFLNDGIGGYPSSMSLWTGEYPTNVAVGDVDGDGLDDIAAICGLNGESKAGEAAAPASATSLEGFSIFLNAGASSFAAPVFVATPGGCPVDVAIADVTGDGVADLVAALVCLSEVQVFPGLGAAAFGAPLSLPISGGPAAVAVQDLDGDTIPDIVALTNMGMLHTMAGLGGGSFSPAAGVATNHGANHLVVRDLDADGRPDVAVLSMSSVVAVHAGLPGGALGPARGYGTFSGAAGLQANDFDGDGDLDLVVNSWSWPSLQFLRNQAGGGPTAVGDEPAFATGVLDVRHPAPNPASGGTRFELRLGSARRVDVDVYDVRGHLVRRLLAGRELGAGSHALSWDLTADDGSNVASGVYFARVRSGEEAVTRKVFVTR